ncbi:MAG TPA: helix-turn-helix transcriptional regulator [Longimicrobiaceae bacterium]|nr:helix-turn-helix transcriptional regulator [Longimicrobiaceae bacterium]
MDIPNLSSKEAEILQLLVAHGEMYGLELVKNSESLKRGTVYVTLSRMGDKGFVESRQVEPADGSGPPKRIYRATGLGARVLRANTAARAAMETAWAF